MEPFLTDWLQHIVERIHFKGFKRILVVRGNKDDFCLGTDIQYPNCRLQAVDLGHVDIQKDDIGLQRRQRSNGLQGINERPGNLHIRGFLQHKLQFDQSKPFIIDKHCLNHIHSPPEKILNNIYIAIPVHFSNKGSQVS
ncbi:hypothetical protein D3C71_1143100 [compost metagenome]